MGPGILYGVLPNQYWENYCKLVTGIRLLHQRSIPESQLLHAHKLIVDFVSGFELLYYQRKASRLHFCRQSLHSLLHLGPETVRLGPGTYYTQWVLERTIGNLTEEMRQPSNPFQNLAERGVRQAQVNSLFAILPDLQPAAKLPRISCDLGNGYILLGARDECQRKIPLSEGQAVQKYYHLYQIATNSENVQVRKWARLRLPNQQIVQTAWKEKQKTLRRVHISRNIMVI